MNKDTVAMLTRLTSSGISPEDALALRRISMTLQRWFELECGDGNEHASWVIVRGHKIKGKFTHDYDGTPHIERHSHHKLDPTPYHTPIPDRENGARKRLDKIMAKYPQLQAYVQTDPRGAALYILNNADVDGQDVSCVYNRGIAVYK